MPEVKWADTALLARGKGKFCNVPILTLDDIEAWLKQCVDDGYVNITQCIDDVRAMRVQP
ncbi:MAG: hypothetical protein E8D44_13205 [Nitrospira sp.]|nr:MAG: hypothetical protein E8D44_13205 [Nitrospira sp.]